MNRLDPPAPGYVPVSGNSVNVFENPEIARTYDAYYAQDFGKQVDDIEKAIVGALIADLPRSPMLELGCGTGHWTEFFISEGFCVTGIDSSKAMLKRAEAKSLPAEFVLASADRIPFDDASFGVLSSIAMLEFVDDQARVIREMYRVLKPGGWLLLGCLNAESVLAKQSQGDEVFEYAKFMTRGQLQSRLHCFGDPQFAFGVHLAEDFILLDGTPDQDSVEPVFMAAKVQKVK